MFALHINLPHFKRSLSADPAVFRKTPRQSSSPRAHALAASRQAQTGQLATLWVRGCRGGHPKAVLIAIAQALEQLPQDFAQGKPSLCCTLYSKCRQAAMISAQDWDPVTNSAKKEEGHNVIYPSELRTALEGNPQAGAVCSGQKRQAWAGEGLAGSPGSCCACRALPPQLLNLPGPRDFCQPRPAHEGKTMHLPVYVPYRLNAMPDQEFPCSFPSQHRSDLPDFMRQTCTGRFARRLCCLQVAISRLNAFAAMFGSHNSPGVSAEFPQAKQLEVLQIQLAQVAAAVETFARVEVQACSGHNVANLMDSYIRGAAMFCSTKAREPGIALMWALCTLRAVAKDSDPDKY